MGQHNLHVQLPHSDTSARVRVHGQCHNMSDHARNFGRVQASHRQHTPDDGVLVSLWQIGTANNDMGHEQSRIGTVLTRVGEFGFGKGSVDPVWFDHWDQSI